MKDWLQQLNQREQVYLLGAAVAVGVYLLFAVIWKPLAGMRDNMLEANLRVRESLGRVEIMVADIKRLESSGGTRGNRSLSQLINASTAAQGISPSRIQASAGGATQIRFEKVSVAGLMRWLDQIENRQGLSVRDASVNQGDRAGIVDASVRVSLGG